MGHQPILRYAITGKCVACTKTEGERYKSQRKAYAAKNSKTVVARVRSWRKANPDKEATLRAEYRERHRDELRARNVLYRQANPTDPLLRRVREARRRARKMNGGGSYTKDDVTDMLRTQKGRCVYCQRNISKQYAVDHIVPVRLGGSSNRTNLRLLCRSCNSSKGGKHPIDFARSRGLLV
jgi:5-methylcytosine-specific restriction endonuclease McrA